MRGLVMLLAAMAWAAAAFAQAPADYVVKFREYRAALNALDLAKAEAAGAEALQLAEAALGENPTVGVLATNLAVVRLQLGRPDAAKAPLEKARALARKGVAPLSPADLALLDAWAGLDGKGKSSRAKLIAAIEGVGAAQPIWRYYAATALASASLEARAFDDAAKAAELRANAADGSGLPADFAKGVALTQKAMALVQDALKDSDKIETNTIIDFKRKQQGLLRDAVASGEQAMALLKPGVPVADASEPTLAVRAWGEAIVWWESARAALFTTGEAVPGFLTERNREWDTEKLGADPLTPTSQPQGTCPVSGYWLPLRFPRLAGDSGLFGSVAVKVQLDDKGVVRDFKPIAQAPATGDFLEAVRKGAIGYQTRPAFNAPSGCSRAGWLYYRVTFYQF